MADIALAHDFAETARATAMRRHGKGDSRFRALTFGAAILVVAIFLGVLIALLNGAWPAIKTFGFSFLWTEKWNPVTEKFGALAPIAGTLISSFLAMAIAVPVGIGIAIFLTELCPRPLKRPVGIAIELLAGIPSIIYGIWGLFVLAPYLQAHVQPWLIDAFADVPLLSALFAGPPYGIGMFTAALILSIMILPFISAVTRDVFETVPAMLKEAAYGLGCTTWEVMWRVVLPYARTGVVG
ncbi:MAG: phosphate ABC transporter permease subunit PstC, partial [Alphaproteobacteria bacterium 62-8]